MPGVGDFNLSAFFRAMGIKNPQPSVRESVQPVVNVGNFDGLTPRYQPPTGAFGGDVGLVAGQTSFIQVTPRTPGGCLIHWAGSDAVDLLFGIRTVPLFVATEVVPTANFSVNPVRALVEDGQSVLVPFVAAETPQINSSQGGTLTSYPWFIPPGNIFVQTHKAAGSNILDWNLIVSDVISGENSTV